MREGIRLTSPARTIVDVAEAGAGPEQVSTAIRQALRRGITTPERLHDAEFKASQRVVDLIQDAIPGPAAARYASPEAFRQALETRLNAISRDHGRPLARLRKEVVFDRLLARLIQVAHGRWVLKGGLALDYRFGDSARTTRDIDIAMVGGEADANRDLLSVQELDIGDSFVFVIERTADLDELDAGAAIRYHVRAELAGRVFDEFVLDVGFDPPDSTDQIQGTDLLEFAGIPRITAPAVPLEVQLAEKVHAYTRTYASSGHPSTRVKDLVDMELIAGHAELDARRLSLAMDDTFSRRGTHTLPGSLPAPPRNWRTPYSKLAKEVGLPQEMDTGFRLASELIDPILDQPGSTERWDPKSRRWSA
jgi:predicted nucleotidyltransferase component of viral defense system